MKSNIHELAEALHNLVLVGDGMGMPVDPETLRAVEERAQAAFLAMLKPAPVTTNVVVPVASTMRDPSNATERIAFQRLESERATEAVRTWAARLLAD